MIKQYFLWLAKLLTIIVIFLVFVPVLLGTLFTVIQPQLFDQTLSLASGKKMVAVLELEGAIDSSKKFLKEIRKQIEREQVQGIVVRINSPGGAVGPSQDIYEAINLLKSKKPIIASMGSVAASGGLYAALGASKVFAQPGTLTGSIGVIMQIPNISKITEKYGVDMVTIKSGKFKDVGNMFRTMSEEDRKVLQAAVDDVRGQFVNAIVEGRGLAVEQVDKFADGRVFSGSVAKDLGLVDAFGGVMEAARSVYEIAGKPLKPEDLPNLYYPENPFDQWSQVLETGLKYFAYLFGVRSVGVDLRYELL